MATQRFRMAAAAERQALARLLSDLRREAALTQRELAQKLGRSQNWVCQRERATGTRVDPAEFVAWCRACGVDPQIGFDRLLAANEP
ncbi:MAG: helix-turn-helix transcriptional regulator [Phycisphaeraceae bacterium]